MIKWVKSKTIWAAAFLGAIPYAIEMYTPEIKNIIGDHFGSEWAVFYGVLVFVVMTTLRTVTTKPLRDK